MPLTLVEADTSQKPILHRLLQLYLDDMSEFQNLETDDSGEFSYEFFDSYWSEAGRHPLLIKVRGIIAGFVFVRETQNSKGELIYSMAEFFVLRSYRGLGIGEEIARMVFDRFEGTWHLPILDENTTAKKFWKKVVWRYSAGHYREFRIPDWPGPIYQFTSPGPRPAMPLEPPKRK